MKIGSFFIPCASNFNKTRGKVLVLVNVTSDGNIAIGMCFFDLQT